jgi:hypothetical protein
MSQNLNLSEFSLLDSLKLIVWIAQNGNPDFIKNVGVEIEGDF